MSNKKQSGLIVENSPQDASRRRIIKSSGLATGIVLLGMQAESLKAAEFERQVISGPPEYNPASEYVFSITGTIAEAMTVGDTVTGQVRAIPITGGTVEGDNFSGIVIPGGADWQLTRSDGVTEIEATYAIQLKADSGEQTLVKVVNRGMIVPAEDDTAERYFRTRIMFTAPSGEFDWLNKAIFLSRVQLHPQIESAVLVEVFRLI